MNHSISAFGTIGERKIAMILQLNELLCPCFVGFLVHPDVFQLLLLVELLPDFGTDFFGLFLVDLLFFADFGEVLGHVVLIVCSSSWREFGTLRIFVLFGDALGAFGPI
tara:strand:- start:106 stop:432 length:327 start_codon:yes stop_codon:yes gene_type:complete